MIKWPLGTIFIFCILLGLAMSPQVLAQKKPPTGGIGVIDVQRIVRESAATKSMRPQLEKIKKAFEGEVKTQEQELRKANQDLSRQRAILSPEAYAERRKELQRRANTVQLALQEKKRSLDQAVGKSMSKVQAALRVVAVELAKEFSIALIMRRSSIYLVEDSLDITPEALKRLDKKLPSVTIVLPEKK